MILAPYLLVAALVAAAPQGAPQEALVRAPEQAEAGPSSQFVAFNRYSTLGIADQGTQWLHPSPTIQAQMNGRLSIEDSQQRIAYRFTMPQSFSVTRAVDALWIYYRSVGTPGLCTISMGQVDPVSGLSAGMSTLAVPFSPLGASATARWHRIELPQSFDVVRGAVYDIIIQPRDNNFDAQNRVELMHLRSRMQVPFLPLDAGDPGGSLRTPFDPHLGTLRDVLSECGFVRWQWPVRNYVPVFLVEHDVDRNPSLSTQPQLIGQPFDRHIERTIEGDAMYGQAFSVPPGGDLDINYLALFVRGAGQSGLANCSTGVVPCNSRPCGDLLVEVYEDGASEPLRSEVLVQGQLSGGTNPVYRARSHWFGAYLDQELTLEADKLYYLMLSSPQSGDENTLDCHDANGDGWDGWVFSAQSSTLQAQPFAPQDLPTYRGTQSYAVRATRTPLGAQEFVPLDDFRADAGFLLGDFPKQRPLAILDEADGDSLVCQTFNTRATASEPMRIQAALRNIGPAAAHGQMFARIRYNGALLDTAYYKAIPSNQESGAGATETLATLNLLMPDTPNARFTLEFGWVDPTLPPASNHIVDDRIPSETHRTQCCVCIQKTSNCQPPGFETQKP